MELAEVELVAVMAHKAKLLGLYNDEDSSEGERMVEGLGRYWLLIWAF